MFLLERGDRPENGIWGDRDGGRNGQVATFLLLYSSITFTVCVCVCVEKVRFPLLLFRSSVF